MPLLVINILPPFICSLISTKELLSVILMVKHNPESCSIVHSFARLIEKKIVLYGFITLVTVNVIDFILNFWFFRVRMISIRGSFLVSEILCLFSFISPSNFLPLKLNFMMRSGSFRFLEVSLRSWLLMVSHLFSKSFFFSPFLSLSFNTLLRSSKMLYLFLR